MTRTRLLSATLAALLLLVQAGGVLAQTPPPIERTPEMEQHAAELEALFPETLGDASLLDNLDINVGQELIGELDPSDRDDAEDIAQLHEMATAAGATLDDAAAATSYAQLDEDAFATVIAYQVRGGDIQQALPLFVAAFEEDIPDALVEQGQVGDQEVTMLRSAEDPVGGSFVILARGDVMWLLIVPPEFLEETIGSLPES
jgi:hypothetical protein